MLKNKEYMTEIKYDENGNQEEKKPKRFKCEPPQLNIKKRRPRKSLTRGLTCALTMREDLETGEAVECGKTFETKAELKEHMQGHTMESDWECHACEKTFGHYVNFHHHLTSQQHYKVKAYLHRKRLREKEEVEQQDEKKPIFDENSH